MKHKISTILLITISLLVLCFSGCGSTDDSQSSSPKDSESAKIEGLDCDNFEITSNNLKDGVWDTIVTNTRNGANKSPQLSWEVVDGANYYSIYMVDTSAGNWLHWKSENVQQTDLELGWAIEAEYKGPCPPSGTHSYEIYVFALKEKPTAKMNIFCNTRCTTFFKQVVSLDTLSDGSSGNVIALGHIKGTYTYGD